MLSFEDLNQAQQDAATFPFKGALRVSAGAGTGKTTVITFRFLEALKRIPGASPSNILCLTFSDRAAGSMRERIIEALGPSANPDELWVHTFHSFCARVLAMHLTQAGLPPGYRLADEAEITLLREDIVSGILSRFVIPHGERDLIPPGALRKVLEAGWAVIEQARRDLHTAQTFEAALEAAPRRDSPQARYERQVGAVFARLFREFDAARQGAGIVDYADLIAGAYWLLRRHPEVSEALSARFFYILVDEFQDTDRAQLELLRLVAHPDFANVTVVGDDKQAIYEWRGARIENLREFEAQEKPLTDNYRSFNEILDLANHSISLDPYFAPKAQKIALSNPQKGYSNGGRVHLRRFASRKEEAEFIADQIERLMEAGIAPGEVAVLYRAATHTRFLEHELRRRGVPYTALGAGFFEREEVHDLMAYLRLAADPTDKEAMVRLLQRPPVSLTQAEVAQVFSHRRDAEKRKEAQRERVKRAAACIEKLRRRARVEPLALLVERAFQESGYAEALAAESPLEAPRSISNISKVIDIASDFAARSPLNGLVEFVRYMERLSLEQLREAEADPQEERDAVKLLTTHKAKGLEFHSVFIADVRKLGFKKKAAFLLDLPPATQDSTAGKIVTKKMPRSKEETQDYNHLLEQRGAKPRHKQEERRIFYVALTRAKENLYITTAAKKPHFFDELAAEFASNTLVEITEPE